MACTLRSDDCPDYVLIKFDPKSAITLASPQLVHIDAWDVSTIVQRRD
jgi:hypothetical protein